MNTVMQIPALSPSSRRCTRQLAIALPIFTFHASIGELGTNFSCAPCVGSHTYNSTDRIARRLGGSAPGPVTRPFHLGSERFQAPPLCCVCAGGGNFVWGGGGGHDWARSNV